MSEVSSSKRIAKNTLMLYFRQILIMLVSLYTVRVVLNVLGAEDYGIYNVVAGVVTMFSFLSGAMATASQRYLSFDLGRKDYEHLKTTFRVSFTIYILIAIVVVILAETIGLWFISYKLVIPPDRLFAARCIYQFAIISFVFTILTTPYMAAIIAHEDMSIYAYVSILEAALKLLVVLLLPILHADSMILYGILLFIVVLITSFTYIVICRNKYAECKSVIGYERSLFRELLGYTGWNLFGASVGALKFQGVNIILNQYFNPVVISARGIASQVNSAVNSFAQNFSTAVRPQIVKSYASGDKNEMNHLVYRSCKGTFFLMYLFTLPLCLEMPFVLQVWLKNPPVYAVVFTQLALIDVLLDSVNYPLMSAAQATGKIKLYQGFVGGVLLLNLPLSLFFLSLGYQPQSVFVIAIVLTLIAGVIRLLILRNIANLSLRQFIIKVYCPIALSTGGSLVVPLLISNYMSSSLSSFIFVLFVSLISISIFSYFILLNKKEKQMIITYIYSRILKKYA